MADSADEAPPAAPAKSGGGLIAKLTNGIGIFVLTLVAVIVGGFINAKLHPMPDLKLDKDGNITAVGTRRPPAAMAREGGGKAAVYYAIDPPLVVNFEDGSVVRFLQISMEVMARDQKAIESVQKNIPLIRNNLLLLMSNRNYQTMMSREGKEKLRHGGARRGPRRAEERRRPGHRRSSVHQLRGAVMADDRRKRRSRPSRTKKSPHLLEKKDGKDAAGGQALRFRGAAHQSHAIAAVGRRQQGFAARACRVAVGPAGARCQPCISIRWNR
jgi:flagellar FliL protein